MYLWQNHNFFIYVLCCMFHHYLWGQASSIPDLCWLDSKYAEIQISIWNDFKIHTLVLAILDNTKVRGEYIPAKIFISNLNRNLLPMHFDIFGMWPTGDLYDQYGWLSKTQCKLVHWSKLELIWTIGWCLLGIFRFFNSKLAISLNSNVFSHGQRR